jgi:hypothetical protein
MRTRASITEHTLQLNNLYHKPPLPADWKTHDLTPRSGSTRADRDRTPNCRCNVYLMSQSGEEATVRLLLRYHSDRMLCVVVAWNSLEK